jgi:regulator of protease activity HflC (stomatin/prohibitin superfamily)
VSAKKMFWMYVIISYAVVLLTSLVFSHHYTAFLGEEWNWGLTLFLALVLYTIVSLQKLGPTELGARIFLGKPIDGISSGLVFVPAVIFELEKTTRLTIQDEHPSVKILFGLPDKNSGAQYDDPYNMQMVTEVAYAIRWQINDFAKLLISLGNIEEARQQMGRIFVSMLTSAFAKITPAVALGNIDAYNENLKKAIENRVAEWGIGIKSVHIKPFEFNNELNTAILGIPKATAEARATIVTAEGDKKKRKLEGEGSGAAEKATLEGRAIGLEKMARKLNISSQSVLAAETARAITTNPGQKTIIAGSSGFKDLTIIGTALNETSTKKET